MNDQLAELKGKVVAVTGASGYIGTAIAARLTELEVQVLRVSRTPLIPVTGMQDLQGDVKSKDCWLDIVSGADAVIHLAGNTSVYGAAADPAESISSTLLPLSHLINACQLLSKCPRVVFASTATVYGLIEKLPVCEEIIPQPVTLYDLHKLFAEEQLKMAANQGILQSVSLRLANVYGPSISASGSNDRGILNRVARMALEGEMLTVFGEDDYLRDYVYIDDVVNTFLLSLVADNITGRTFNVTTGTGNSIFKAFSLVAALAEKLTLKQVEVKRVPWPDGADAIEFRNFIGSTVNLQSALNWHPQITLETGIAKMLNYFHNKT